VTVVMPMSRVNYYSILQTICRDISGYLIVVSKGNNVASDAGLKYNAALPDILNIFLPAFTQPNTSQTK